jgi:thiamine biosynthesis lipoprotein
MVQEIPPLVSHFQAMGCSCELLLDTTDPSISSQQLTLALEEVERIEKKYSRYRKGNIVDEINSSPGKRITVDDETAAILDFADQCYAMSEGLFDITTGILRKIWQFEGSEATLQAEELARLRTRMGWDKVSWKRPTLELPSGFEIDLGGICKEYAADKILALLRQRHPISTLVNLGGDIAAAGTRLWSVGIEDFRHPGQVAKTVHIRQGGIATSGTTKRFVKVKGETYGHILNPKTGWPVKNAPESVTVAAKTCTEAGFWSTLAVLHGEDAEAFLKEQFLEFWCFRSSSKETVKK